MLTSPKRRLRLASFLVAGLMAVLSATPTALRADELRGAPLVPRPATGPDELAPMTGSGAVAHAVDDEGTLWLAVSLRGAAPSRLYELFLVCGPTVEEACGYAPLGWLGTSEGGDADSGEIGVELGSLEAGPFGSGERRDHVTVVDWRGGGSFVSAPLAYGMP